jgi:lysophospholipase L1-like esterase
MSVFTLPALRSQIAARYTPGSDQWTGQENEDSQQNIVDSLEADYIARIASAVGGLSGNGSSLAYSPIPIKYGRNINAFGNSITEGSASSPFTNSYIELLKVAIGASTLTNRGVSGMASKQALALINQSGALPTSRTDLATWMLGVNDIIFSTSNGAKFSNTDAALEFLCNAFASSIIDSTSGTETGTWSNWGSGIANGGRTTGRLTSTANDQVTFSLGSGSGRLFVVLYANPETDTENWANSVEISYPGQVFTVNPNKSRNNFGHYTVVIDTHAYTLGGTLTIKNLSGGKMVVDYVGACKLPQNCYPALVYDTTKVSDYWYSKPGSGHAPGVNGAWIDTCNLDARNAVMDKFKAWAYPVAVVESNRYFVPNSMTPDPTNTDGIHPTNIGHYAIHKASMEALQLIPTVY